MDPGDGRRRIVAASHAARLDGVKRGMASTTATAIAPELCVRPVNSSAMAAAHRDLEAAIRSIAPHLETTGAGVLYSSYQGLARRYPNDGEAGFIEDLRRVVSDLGFPVRVGMAGSRFVSRVAAIMEGCRSDFSGVAEVVVADDRERVCAFGIRVLAGRERDFLAPMPIELLPDALVEIATLKRLGILSMGALAALDASAVTRRLGPKGLVLHRLARGLDRCTLVPSAEPRRFHSHCSMDAPVVDVEALSFVLRPSLHQLLESLSGQGLAARVLQWSLEFEGSEPPWVGKTSAASPTASAPLWSRLLKLEMDRLTLKEGVVGVQLEALEVGRGPREQQRVTGPRSPAPGALSVTLAHLAAELGDARHGVLRAEAHVWPESRCSLTEGEFPGRVRVSGSSSFRLVPQARPSRGQLLPGFRRLSPPRPIEVELLPSGQPFRFRVGDRLRTVERVFGPWDLSSGWWNHEQQRRYFQLQGEGAIAQVYYETCQRCWFLDGWID